MPDATERFLQSLPEIRPGERFRFSCHPDVRCFNACCGDLTLNLTPYDVLRLRRFLGLSSQEFITRHAAVITAPDTGLPMLQLRMQEGPGNPCPYVRAEGCSVYPDRPAACRTYPLGRATRLLPDGTMGEQFFLVREDHCKGFDEDREWTTDEWLEDQGLDEYNAANDRLMRLLARAKGLGRPVDTRHANMAVLALFQPDRFQDFVRDMRLFDRLEVEDERARAVLEDEYAALDFGLDWLELVIFGDCERLRKREKPS